MRMIIELQPNKDKVMSASSKFSMAENCCKTEFRENLSLVFLSNFVLSVTVCNDKVHHYLFCYCRKINLVRLTLGNIEKLFSLTTIRAFRKSRGSSVRYGRQSPDTHVF
jgi:hypothetical protein